MGNKRYMTEARPRSSTDPNPLDEYYVVVDSKLENDVGYYVFKNQADRMADELNNQINLCLDDNN